MTKSELCKKYLEESKRLDLIHSETISKILEQSPGADDTVEKKGSYG